MAATHALLLFISLACSHATPHRVMQVGLYADDGVSGLGPGKLEETFSQRTEFRLVKLTGEDIRQGNLARVHALIMPGGSAIREAASLGPIGRKAIQRFIEHGGCYVGICAGCYLASTEYSWSLGVLPAKVVDRSTWLRSRTLIQIELSPTGQRWLGMGDKPFACVYHNGPVLEPDREARTRLIPLAIFREEVVKRGNPPGEMIGSPAIAAARYGKGWAIGISPHPEQTSHLTDMVPTLIRQAVREKSPSQTATTRR